MRCWPPIWARRPSDSSSGRRARATSSPAEAAAIARELPADVAPIGVFVDAPVDDVRRIAALVGLAAVQLHGDEPPTLCDELPYRVLKAVAVAGAATHEAAERVPARVTVLLDARDPVRKGGYRSYRGLARGGRGGRPPAHLSRRRLAPGERG